MYNPCEKLFSCICMELSHSVSVNKIIITKAGLVVMILWTLTDIIYFYHMTSLLFSGRDHFLARFRDILAFYCMKSHTNSRSEKKNRTSNFSHFTPQSLFFAHAVHFETFGQFYTIGFRIIFAPLFVSYTIAGSFSTASRCVLSEFR